MYWPTYLKTNKPAFFISISIILILISAPAFCAETADSLQQSERDIVINQVVQQWLEVGQKQYQRFLYKQAENSFNQALEYQDYLTAGDIETINEYLKDVQAAISQRQIILQQIQRVELLTEQGHLAEAISRYEIIAGSEFLSEDENVQIAKRLNETQGLLDEQKHQMLQLYNRSVKLCKRGELELAREGFIEAVASGLLTESKTTSAENYLLKIEDVLIQNAQAELVIEEDIERDMIEIADSPDAGADELIVEVDSGQGPLLQIEVIERAEQVDENSMSRKNSIIKSYTRAVVNDALKKAHEYINDGQFELAESVVGMAGQRVNENREEIGEDAFGLYTTALEQLAKKIVQEK